MLGPPPTTRTAPARAFPRPRGCPSPYATTVTSDLRYGIVGAGMMGLEHFRNLQALPGAIVTAVADPHPESRERARLTAAEDRLACFATHDELLESGLVDAVVVASPNM